VDYRDSDDEAAFRAALREWLVANNPGGAQSSTDEAYWEKAAAWHRSLYDAGWFGVSYPERFGGRGLPPVYEAIVDSELGWASAPPKPSLGYIVHGMLRHADEDTCQRFLRGMISGRDRWCQGFSEPDAGSDLAGLRTTAVLDGDDYVVHGHKIWTSYSETADWCILLARTDPTVAKHRGISAFALPMRQPGVTQIPLRMINGISNEFGQVILDGARVPAENMIGDPGSGWPFAMTVLNHERSPADLGYTARYGRAVRALEDLAASRGVPSSAARHALALAFVHSEVLAMHVMRRLSERLSDIEPGPEGAVDKLLMTTTEQLVGHAAREIGSAPDVSLEDSTWLNMYLYSRAATVMGGTSQIQKNVIATQVLELPRTP
jgi:alkylation response protein AidB-like acyl-CoA dehydrogenase